MKNKFSTNYQKKKCKLKNNTIYQHIISRAQKISHVAVISFLIFSIGAFIANKLGYVILLGYQTSTGVVAGILLTFSYLNTKYEKVLKFAVIYTCSFIGILNFLVLDYHYLEKLWYVLGSFSYLFTVMYLVLWFAHFILDFLPSNDKQSDEID